MLRMFSGRVLVGDRLVFLLRAGGESWVCTKLEASRARQSWSFSFVGSDRHGDRCDDLDDFEVNNKTFACLASRLSFPPSVGWSVATRVLNALN